MAAGLLGQPGCCTVTGMLAGAPAGRHLASRPSPPLLLGRALVARPARPGLAGSDLRAAGGPRQLAAAGG
jgi:hypothetical protein